MSRNVQFQILRGTRAQLSSIVAGVDPDTGNAINPLQFGELYFATDTLNIFMGTPGLGIGYIQIGDTTQVNERLEQLILIMESVRRALVALACEGGKSQPVDFDLVNIAAELSGTDSLLK